jgi:hypothetical protein
MNNSSQTTTSDWTGLYKLASLSALAVVAIIIIQGIFAAIEPQPLHGTAIDWFMLFQKNNLIGLIDFELLMVVYVIVSIPVILALFIALRHVNPSWTAIYLVLSLIGVMSFIAARPALEMLSLSQGYAAATSDAERAIFLAAGQVLVATFHGTAFQISYVLGSITGLIISLVMLRTNIFGRATAYVRIASSVFDFGIYVPTIGIFIAMFSVLFLLIWNIMIARKLYQLGQVSAKEKGQQAGIKPLAASRAGN